MARRPLSDALYQRLTPSERHRLAIEASARADLDEVRQLADTCPSATYWCTDPEYADRCAASSLIALTASHHLLWAFVPVAAIRAAKTARTEAAELLMNHVSAAAADEFRSSEESSRIDLEEKRAVIAGVCKGITRFCHEIAVSPLSLLALAPSCLQLFETYSDFDIGPCDDETAEAMYEELSLIWACVVPGERNRR